MENKQKCDMCGEERQTKPAGPNGENVCLRCAKTNPDALAAYLAKECGVNPSDPSGKAIANAAVMAITQIIRKAYKIGVKIEKLELEEHGEDLVTVGATVDYSRFEETFRPSIREHGGLLAQDGKPSADVAAKCDA